MPPESTRPGSPQDWMLHAKGDLALARIDKPSDVLPEQLCFHAQQAAEKALKAILIKYGISPPLSHHIGLLIEKLPSNLHIPGEIHDASALTAYAVASRYPGDYEPIEKDELADTIQMADKVVSWAEGLL